jgi:predicted nuclease with TOPRIM domain
MMSKKLAKATEIFMRQEQLKRQLEECRVQLDVAMKEKVRLLKGLNNKTKEYFRKTTMSTFSLSLSLLSLLL